MINLKESFLNPSAKANHSIMDSSKSQPNSPPMIQQHPTTPPPPPPSSSSAVAARSQSKTTVHVTALDGIVNVNSLFTVAIFIGLSLTVPSAGGAGNKPACIASVDLVRKVIVFEVISFSFFLFSSLIAQSLKLAINLVSGLDSDNPHKADIDSFCMKYGMLGSAVGSVVGCTFLMLSIVNFVQVKLGVLSCGGEAVYAVVTLVVLAGASILVYVLTAVYAFCFI